MQKELHEQPRNKEIGFFFFPDVNFKSGTQCKNKEDTWSVLMTIQPSDRSGKENKLSKKHLGVPSSFHPRDKL